METKCVPDLALVKVQDPEKKKSDSLNNSKKKKKKKPGRYFQNWKAKV